jgi:hypothetical protein
VCGAALPTARAAAAPAGSQPVRSRTPLGRAGEAPTTADGDEDLQLAQGGEAHGLSSLWRNFARFYPLCPAGVRGGRSVRSVVAPQAIPGRAAGGPPCSPETGLSALVDHSWQAEATGRWGGAEIERPFALWRQPAAAAPY